LGILGKDFNREADDRQQTRMNANPEGGSFDPNNEFSRI
jgi:hypothetical protein